MGTLRTVLSSIACATIGALVGERIEWSPVSGETLEKRFTREVAWTLERFDLELADERLLDFAGSSRDELRESFVARFTDRCATIVDGRPSTLERQFDELALEQRAALNPLVIGSAVGTRHAKSRLENRAVRFAWNDAEHAFDATARDGGLPLDAPDALEENSDLRGFAPDRAVEIGDAWRAEPTALARLLEPGGALGFVDDDGVAREPWLDRGLLASLDSGPRVHFTSIDVEDGRRIAVLKLDGKSRAEQRVDATQAGFMFLSAGILAEPGASSDRCDFEFDGELRWDLDARRADRIELKAVFERRVSIDAHENCRGERVRIDKRWSGELRATASLR